MRLIEQHFKIMSIMYIALKRHFFLGDSLFISVCSLYKINVLEDVI